MRLQSPPTESAHFSTWVAPCASGNVHIALGVIQRDAERSGQAPWEVRAPVSPCSRGGETLQGAATPPPAPPLPTW